MSNLLNQIKEKLKGNDKPLAQLLRNTINAEEKPSLIINDLKTFTLSGNYVMMRELFGKPLITDILNYK